MDGLKTLEAQAAAGDGAAQYRLAAHLDRQGRAQEARQWMAKAAAGGHPGALYTQATALLSAPPGAMRISEAVSALQRAAKAGGAAAARQLAVLTALGLGVERDWRAAVALVFRAARTGHPGALRECAMLAELASPGSGRGLLRAAAMKGDWIAAYLALRAGGALSAAEGGGLAQKLRAARAPLAERLCDPDETAPACLPDFSSLERTLADFDPATEEVKKSFLHRAPDIFRVERLLPPLVCDYVICAAAGLLKPSAVVNSEKASADHAAFRTSDGAMFGLLDLDLALMAVYARLARGAGLPAAHCELMGVLRYRPGQEYKPHHDYLPEDAADYSEVKRSGQRMRTLLVSLNDGFEGGETVFPKLDLRYAGKTGDALAFHNTDDAEKPYPETLHAGAPVSAGEKWLLTLWIRARPFWFWV